MSKIEAEFAGLRIDRKSPAITAATIVLIVGSLTIAGAWFFQLVLHLAPCPLCLEQRWPYYFSIPLAAMTILGVQYGAQPRVLLLALLALAAFMLYGAGLGVYHSGIEWKWWPGPLECSGGPDIGTGGDIMGRLNRINIVRCDEPAWRDPVVGLSLAGYNVLISLALAAVCLWGALAAWRSDHGSSSVSQ